MRKKILTVFCNTENVHLIKDVGMIPFLLQKNYQHHSTLATYKNGNYPYLNKEVYGLNIVFIKKIFNNPSLDFLLFLLFNAKKYDVLMTFHMGMHTIRWFKLYKFLNSRGVTYLKLDTNLQTSESTFFNSKKVRKFVKTIDIISCETKLILKKVQNSWKRKIEYVPNGFYNFDNNCPSHELKEKRILCVGRLASPEKNVIILVKAFCNISHKFPDWKLTLVGEIDEHTYNKFRQIQIINDVPENRIEFTGHIEDRDLLSSYYAKASIFTLPSLFEGFALVYLEAAKAGCYIISSDIPPAFDITDNGRLGTLFENNNVVDLEEKMTEILSNFTSIQKLQSSIEENAYRNFYWPVIVDKINKIIFQ